jgi:hypothetical protein
MWHQLEGNNELTFVNKSIAMTAEIPTKSKTYCYCFNVSMLHVLQQRTLAQQH